MLPEIVDVVLVFNKYPYAIPVVGVEGIDVVRGIPAVIPLNGKGDARKIDREIGNLQVVGL